MPSAMTETVIYPLNEAIRRRLEEKRREREEAARREAEHIAEVKRREQLVARLIVDWLAQNEGIEVDPNELSAVLRHDRSYRVTWRRGNAYVELQAPVTLHEEPEHAWVEVMELEHANALWKGVKGHVNTYMVCGRFVDAVIYALGLDADHYPISAELMEV